MLDLGNSFLASVERDPNALALVDGDVRMTYAQWYERISALVAGFDRLGLMPGDHLVTVLQNRWEAATLHWACQFAGIVITPINWRAKADEIDFYLENSEAKAVVYQDISAAAVAQSKHAAQICRIGLDEVDRGVLSFSEMTIAMSYEAEPRVSSDAWSVMLYTSGTTSRPKGVPRPIVPNATRQSPMSRKTCMATANARWA